MKVIKLTVKDHCTVKRDSSPDVPANEFVEIPPNHYGEFYIRLCHGKEGILVPASPFPAKWEGVPKITVVNNSANDLHLRAGDEIGELHIRYDPPSPFFGDEMALSLPICIKRKDDKILVISRDLQMFECEELLEFNYDDHKRLTAETVPTDWCRIDFISSFKPASVMINYKQISPPTRQDLFDCEIVNNIVEKYFGHVHTHTDCDGSTSMVKSSKDSVPEDSQLVHLNLAVPTKEDYGQVLDMMGVSIQEDAVDK